jgi:hypothetical protein
MNLIDQLHAGNTRANRDFIADWVGRDSTRFAQLMHVYLEGEMREAQLAAGVLFCCLENHSELFIPWLPKMVRRMDEAGVHPAVRRVVVRVLMEIDTPKQLQGRVVDLCFKYLSDPSEPIAVRVFAMGTVAHIAESEPDLWRELRQTIEMVLPYSTAAFQAHARKVFKRARARRSS